MRYLSTIERAFEIAREGKCRDMAEIGRQLSAEGYGAVQSHLAGSSIRKQLVALLKEAGGDHTVPTEPAAPS